MKIAITTAYYNRRKIFLTTLNSIKNSKFVNNTNIIVVDDGSDENERLDDIKQIQLIRINKNDKRWINPCIPFNIAFSKIEKDTDIVILQNPECFHNGDILDFAVNNITDNNYISFACYSLSKLNTEKLMKNETMIMSSQNGRESMWFNHSTKNPTGYHFCAAITYKNLCKLQGFNEEFGSGLCYDDNEILHRIKSFLDVKIIDIPNVFHMYHYSVVDDAFNDNQQKAFERNQKLLENYKDKKEIILNNKIFTNK